MIKIIPEKGNLVSLSNAEFIQKIQNNFRKSGLNPDSTEICSMFDFIENEFHDEQVYFSDDLSCFNYNSIPLIFFGTNFWFLLKFYSNETLCSIAANTARIYAGQIDNLGNCELLHLVVPEKDCLISSALNPSLASLNKNIFKSTSTFLNCYSDITGSKIIDTKSLYFNIASSEDLAYNDSHLPLSCYLSIAQIIIDKIKPGIAILDYVQIVQQQTVLDLGAKLNNKYEYEIVDQISAAETVSLNKDFADNTFKNPLRNSSGSAYNHKAPISKKILLAGDSHSSLLFNSKLSDLLSHVFKRVDFVWQPYLIYGDPEGISYDDYDYIIMEISERFIYGTPSNK